MEHVTLEDCLRDDRIIVVDTRSDGPQVRGAVCLPVEELRCSDDAALAIQKGLIPPALGPNPHEESDAVKPPVLGMAIFGPGAEHVAGLFGSLGHSTRTFPTDDVLAAASVRRPRVSTQSALSFGAAPPTSSSPAPSILSASFVGTQKATELFAQQAAAAAAAAAATATESPSHASALSANALEAAVVGASAGSAPSLPSHMADAPEAEAGTPTRWSTGAPVTPTFGVSPSRQSTAAAATTPLAADVPGALPTVTPSDIPVPPVSAPPADGTEDHAVATEAWARVRRGVLHQPSVSTVAVRLERRRVQYLRHVLRQNNRTAHHANITSRAVAIARYNRIKDRTLPLTPEAAASYMRYAAVPPGVPLVRRDTTGAASCAAVEAQRAAAGRKDDSTMVLEANVSPLAGTTTRPSTSFNVALSEPVVTPTSAFAPMAVLDGVYEVGDPTTPGLRVLAHAGTLPAGGALAANAVANPATTGCNVGAVCGSLVVPSHAVRVGSVAAVGSPTTIVTDGGWCDEGEGRARELGEGSDDDTAEQAPAAADAVAAPAGGAATVGATPPNFNLAPLSGTPERKYSPSDSSVAPPTALVAPMVAMGGLAVAAEVGPIDRDAMAVIEGEFARTWRSVVDVLRVLLYGDVMLFGGSAAQTAAGAAPPRLSAIAAAAAAASGVDPAFLSSDIAAALELELMKKITYNNGPVRVDPRTWQLRVPRRGFLMHPLILPQTLYGDLLGVIGNVMERDMLTQESHLLYDVRKRTNQLAVCALYGLHASGHMRHVRKGFDDETVGRLVVAMKDHSDALDLRLIHVLCSSLMLLNALSTACVGLPFFHSWASAAIAAAPTGTSVTDAATTAIASDGGPPPPPEFRADATATAADPEDDFVPGGAWTAAATTGHAKPAEPAAPEGSGAMPVAVAAPADAPTDPTRVPKVVPTTPSLLSPTDRRGGVPEAPANTKRALTAALLDVLPSACRNVAIRWLISNVLCDVDAHGRCLKKTILLLPGKAGDVIFYLYVADLLIEIGHRVIMAVPTQECGLHAWFQDFVYDFNLNRAFRQPGRVIIAEDKPLLHRFVYENRYDLVLIKRDLPGHILPHADLFVGSANFFRAWRMAEIVIAAAEHRAALCGLPLTRDVYYLSSGSTRAGTSGMPRVLLQPKDRTAPLITRRYIDSKAAQFIQYLYRAKKYHGKVVVFGSCIIGSLGEANVPTTIAIAKYMEKTFTATDAYRTLLVDLPPERILYINPATGWLDEGGEWHVHWEPGFDGDAMMEYWSQIQHSGFMDIWYFQASSDVRRYFGALPESERPGDWADFWARRDWTHSKGCMQEMIIAREVKEKFPNLQVACDDSDTLRLPTEELQKRCHYNLGDIS